MVRSNRAIAMILVLLSGEASGFASTRLRTRSSNSRMKTDRVTSTSKSKKSKIRVCVNGHRWQSKTCLTSAHVGVRRSSEPFRWLRSLSVHNPTRWASRLLRRKGSRRLLYSAALALIVAFAPAFSPAARAASTTASTTSGLSPVMPFSNQSRALGTFNFLPTRAEMELCFRLLYAAASGAFVGMERSSSSSDRPAGVRTMALVGLGACTYAICGAHGFLPHSALGYGPSSPLLEGVKVDLSRMASSVASGVGFIGAGAIHKSKLHGSGTESQNVVAGLTTAAAIWVSAAVGIASAVGLYFVGAVATFSTVAILKYARIPKEEEPGFSWEATALDVVDEHVSSGRSNPQDRVPIERDSTSGLFGKHAVTGYDPEGKAFIDQAYIDSYSHPFIVKEVIDPRFEKYLRSRFDLKKDDSHASEEKELCGKSKVLIEEEQEVVSPNPTSENEEGPSAEP